MKKAETTCLGLAPSAVRAVKTIPVEAAKPVIVATVPASAGAFRSAIEKLNLQNF